MRQGGKLAALTVALLVATAAPGMAWPVSLMQALAKDARRLVPRTLVHLMAQREKEIFEEAQRFPPELSQALAGDFARGELQPGTMAMLEARTGAALALIKQQRVSEGIVALGALLRIPADLSDPILFAGPEGLPSGVSREYYAFVSKSLDKIPVVLDDPKALTLTRRELPGYWQGLVERSRDHAPVIRTEMFRRGQVVDHRTIDYRSPVFGVGSLAYSRAVNAIAVTWLALWREARGDVTRMPQPVVVRPKDAPPLTASSPAMPPSGGHTP